MYKHIIIFIRVHLCICICTIFVSVYDRRLVVSVGRHAIFLVFVWVQMYKILMRQVAWRRGWEGEVFVVVTLFIKK